MATYNGGRYLLEQLESLSGQTRPPDELIITDDGSTDDTLEIARTFAKDAPFMVDIFSNPKQLGYAANFERAIGKCTGDVIFLSDQDDVWFPARIETILEAFALNPTCQCLLNGQILTDDALRSAATVDRNMRALGRRSRDLVIGCATAVRGPWAKLLFPIPKDARAFFANGYMSHDRWINELSEFAGLRLYLDRPLQYWRRHGLNVTEADLHDPQSVGMKGKRALSRAPIGAWQDRIATLDTMAEFVRQRHAEIDAFASMASRYALDMIDGERRAHASRIDIYESGRVARVAKIVRLALAGGYTYFNGVRSVLTDLSRR